MLKTLPLALPCNGNKDPQILPGHLRSHGIWSLLLFPAIAANSSCSFCLQSSPSSLMCLAIPTSESWLTVPFLKCPSYIHHLLDQLFLYSLDLSPHRLLQEMFRTSSTFITYHWPPPQPLLWSGNTCLDEHLDHHPLYGELYA